MIRFGSDPSSLADDPAFIETLVVAVALWTHRLAGMRLTDSQLAARASNRGRLVGNFGDKIQFVSKGHRRRHTDGVVVDAVPSSAEAFNALAEGVAAAALVDPAGVRVFGRHFPHPSRIPALRLDRAGIRAWHASLDAALAALTDSNDTKE